MNNTKGKKIVRVKTPNLEEFEILLRKWIELTQKDHNIIAIIECMELRQAAAPARFALIRKGCIS